MRDVPNTNSPTLVRPEIWSMVNAPILNPILLAANLLSMQPVVVVSVEEYPVLLQILITHMTNRKYVSVKFKDLLAVGTNFRLIHE